ncbi:MAG: SusC/RagA family protein [Sphingobacteriales bacterium 50-39]|nr:SusC/RagA family TonB-linked outer membrane protein [Sphingobacteriales bacterium]OJW59620.1 MAG: SusC/RagA family protein [Sphingobacteriales bacterium 50-39]
MITVRATLLFLFLWCLHVAGQSPGGSVKVHVADEAGQPLPGITVQIKGTPRKYVSGVNGDLTINNVPAGAVLVFSGVSIEEVELAVDGRSEMTTRLKRKVAALEDVVVTGFQRIDRKKFTGSAVTVKADSIKLDGVTDISRMLEGRAAGVSIQNVSGTFGAAPKVRIRGATSINGENKPLWVVDGVVLEDIVNVSNEQLTSGDASTLLGSSVAGLNINDIETFDILKDASAAAVYGARAMNGVIVITTKKGKSGTPAISYTGNFGLQLRPSYTSYDIMNSADQMSVNAELERKGLIVYPQLVNAPNSGIYGELARLLQYPDANGNFAVQNTPEGRQAWLMKYANINTNWFKQLFRNSVNQQHTLSITSGNEKAQSYISTSFFTDPGWSVADKVKSYTLNFRQDYTMNSKLSFGFLAGGNVRQQQTAGTENRTSDPLVGQYSRDFDINPFSYALNISRTLPAYNSNGSYNYSTQNFAPFNILSELKNNYTKLNVLDGRLQGRLSYKLTPHITYDFTGALRYVKTTEEHDVLENSNEANAYRVGDPNQPGYNSIINASNPFLYQDPTLPFNQAVSVLPYGGFYKRTDRTLVNYTFRNTISYNETFDDRKHAITALLGQEYRSVDRQTANDVGVGYQYNTGGTPFVNYLFFKKMVESNDTYYGMFNEYERAAAFFANAQYTYDNKYTVMGTVRADGSNRMGNSTHARWLPTWTVAGVWNIDQEQFLEGVRPTLSHLMLKSSYGLNASVGNAINSTTILKSQITNRQYQGDQQTSITIQDLKNGDLTWEKKYELNVGVDAGFFNERMGLTVDWYDRKSFDLIGLIRTSGIGGEVYQYANYADMKSHGLDISLTGRILANKEWNISSTLNFGWNVTNITNLKSTPNIWQLVGEGGGAQQGFPVRGLFSIANRGLDPYYGYPIFLNDSGIVSPVVNLQSTNTKYLKYEGPADPTITGGWSNSFRYKDFSLNVLITYQMGSKVRLRPVYGVSYSDMFALPNEFKRRWELPGDEKLTNIPSIAMFTQAGYQLQQQSAFPYNNYNYSSDRVADGGFARLKAVTFSYLLPGTLMTRLGMRSGSLSVTGNNLWLIYSDSRLHGQDPEFFGSGGVALPVNKQITFSLKLGI